MSKIKQFNNWLAEKITNAVATMWCAYLFSALAFISFPAAVTSHSVVIIVAWIAQTFLQLVLLSIILVGQKIQDEKQASHSDKLDAIHTHLKENIK